MVSMEMVVEGKPHGDRGMKLDAENRPNNGSWSDLAKDRQHGVFANVYAIGSVRHGCQDREVAQDLQPRTLAMLCKRPECA